MSVTTGAWTAADRVSLLREWTVLPDHASVNWHEEGAEDVARALLDKGVAVHAGIFSGTDGATRFRASGYTDRVQRILAEVIPPVVDVDTLLAALAGLSPILLHGEDASDLAAAATSTGVGTRHSHRAGGHAHAAGQLTRSRQRRPRPGRPRNSVMS